ncbi:hypothetical protein [Cohnella soli]|uniref:Uncharacterized protein n=1 Tax=Cohnella soli TaxID=425005 RepID=A0ABW0HU13_9BACL
MADKEYSFDPIVPFLFIKDKKEQMIEAMRKLNREAGLRRFILVFPTWDGEAKGATIQKAFEAFGDLVGEVGSRMAADGIEVGWWCAPSLSIDPLPSEGEVSASAQKIVGIDGAVSKGAYCPLDKQFMSSMGTYMQTVVERGRPPYIFFEDDYEMSNHDVVRFGCFCPLHMKRFSEFVGKEVSREELQALFRSGGDQAVAYRKVWANLMKDSLVELSSSMRRAVDEIAPDTRMALCQSFVCDLDGDFTEGVAKALAGGTRPLVRLFGSDYSSDQADHFASLTFHMLHAKMTLGDEFELIHESDPFPHSRFFFSAAKLRALMSLALFYGFDGSLSYVTQYTDGPLEDEGYFRMIGRNRAFFNELMRVVQGFRIVGPQVLYRPHAQAHRPVVGNHPPVIVTSAWAAVLGKMGIPYTARSGQGPVMICGEDILDLSDEELRELLGSGVFLDGLAAMYACRRGYGDMLGVDVTELEVALCDTLVSERLTKLDEWTPSEAGERMYFVNLAMAVQQYASVFHIKPKYQEVRVMSELWNDCDEAVVPAVTLYENSLGGRVAVMAYDLRQNASASIYNHKRKEQIRGITEWLGRSNLPVYAVKDPNVFVSAQENPKTGDKLIAVYNLSLDPLEQVTLAIDAGWSRSYAYRLQDDGVWTLVDQADNVLAKDKVLLRVQGAFATLQPLVLRLSNQAM